MNQQFVQRIPTNALDRLQPDQVVSLVETSFAATDKLDERQFRFAIERLHKNTSVAVTATIVGGLIALAGFGTVAYLIAVGSESVAGIVATFLATTISVALGSRLVR